MEAPAPCANADDTTTKPISATISTILDIPFRSSRVSIIISSMKPSSADGILQTRDDRRFEIVPALVSAPSDGQPITRWLADRVCHLQPVVRRQTFATGC